MADRAALLYCLMRVNPGTSLLCVTLEAGFVSAEESEAAGFERLLNVGRRAFDSDSFVRFMTIGATHFAFEYRMVVRQLKCRANFQVTLETGVRGFSRIDDRARASTRFNVQAAR